MLFDPFSTFGLAAFVDGIGKARQSWSQGKVP